MTCEIGEHEFGDWSGWVHPVGSNAAYRERTCGCGHVEHEGRGLFVEGEYAVDLEAIPVTGGLEEWTVGDALRALQ